MSLNDFEGFASLKSACSKILNILFGFFSVSFGSLYGLSQNAFLIFPNPSGESAKVSSVHSSLPRLVSPPVNLTLNVLFFSSIFVISNVKNDFVLSLFGGKKLSKNGNMSLAHFSNPYLGFSQFHFGDSIV
jgi:hypothetical protein